MSCWSYIEGTLSNITKQGSTPCAVPEAGDFVTCCGKRDQCLEGNICRYKNESSPGDPYSGYYTAGCTDPTFKSPLCSPACSSYGIHEIVYNTSSGLWQCCGVNSEKKAPTCNAPTSETFQGPAPVDIQPYSYTGKDSKTATSTKTSASSSATPGTALASPVEKAQSSPSGSTVPAASGTLSTGAKAGIGVASALASVAFLILLAIAIFWRRRRRQGRRGEKPTPTVSDPWHWYEQRLNEMRSHWHSPPPDLPPQEMEAHGMAKRAVHELGDPRYGDGHAGIHEMHGGDSHKQ